MAKKQIKRIEKNLFQLMAESIESDLRLSVLAFCEAETQKEAYQLKLDWLRSALKTTDILKDALIAHIDYVEEFANENGIF